MNDNSFFKPTLLYKEFMILDLIEKDQHITQREISKMIGVAVSMVNSYLDDYEKKGLIVRKYKSTKTVEYFVTVKGSESRKLLNINYLHNSQQIYEAAKNDIKKFIEELYQNNIRKLVIYGAGDVASIILNVLYSDSLMTKFVLFIVDDDEKKIGKELYGIKIMSLNHITNIDFDSIFLGSYTYRDIMYKKIIEFGIPKIKIIKYFD